MVGFDVGAVVGAVVGFVVGAVVGTIVGIVLGVTCGVELVLPPPHAASSPIIEILHAATNLFIETRPTETPVLTPGRKSSC